LAIASLPQGLALSVSQLANEQVQTNVQNVQGNGAWGTLDKVGLPLVAMFFAALLPLWFSFEHRIPSIDESGHILNAFSYADLFRHPHFFRSDWWHQLLTVNSFYPPFAHMVNGLSKAVFGGSRSVDIAVLTLFNIVLTLSVYGIAKRLTKSVLCAFFSAIIINFYPELALINRAFWLDFPLTAMVGLSLFALFEFRDKPTWQRALWAGVAVGCACMTKQIAAAYIGLPLVAVICERLINKSRSRADFLQLGIVASTAALLSAPWFILNVEKAKLMADDCAVHITQAQSFGGNLAHYAQVLPAVMSPLLMALFLVALVVIRRTVASNLYPLILSAVGGVLAVSTLAWILPKPQYIAPALITTAIVSGCFVARLAENPRRLVRTVGWLIVAAALAQILSLEFSPYPISQPKWLGNFARALGNNISEPRLGIILVNPRPDVDWGQYWVVKTIDKTENGNTVWLNILSNSPDLNVHTFELIARDLNSAVKPTTSRVYTIGGDTASFSPEKALYYQWYLIQSENHYQGFADQASEKAFEQLKQFVKSDRRFTEMASRPLPDGSTITLFRQK
jgi:hypothetical protein